MQSAIKDQICHTGLGLRAEHYRELLAPQAAVHWLEAVSDNYMQPGGAPLAWLHRLRERYPLVFHGVGLSVGSAQGLDRDYLGRLKRLQTEFQPTWFSDHLCFSNAGGRYSHDLLPLPYTEEAIAVCVQNIRQVQACLGEQILIENVSSYLSFGDSQMPEWEFLSAVVEQADCRILLDVNNIAVSAHNHGYEPQQYLAAIPHARVAQIHLAGYEDAGDHRLDTHGQCVHDEVWALYEQALKLCGAVPTNIEWDRDIPALDVLLTEMQAAQSYLDALS